MWSTISDIDRPRKITIEIATITGDVSATLQNTNLPAKFRLASEVTMVETIAMIIIGAMSNEVIIETHQIPADKTVDPGFRGCTMCHPKNF
jgi:hypothetical protein